MPSTLPGVYASTLPGVHTALMLPGVHTALMLPGVYWPPMLPGVYWPPMLPGMCHSCYPECALLLPRMCHFFDILVQNGRV